MLLDFDPSVVGISSQPFWLFWRSDAGKGISHAPDYFARRDDGTAIVVDCLAAFAEPQPLMTGASTVGDPIGVLPVLFHLLWSHELSTDVSVPLHALSLVSAGTPR